MFNTTIHKTENHDLEIATRERYQNKINWLESDLRKSCTPEQLEHAENIAESFRDKLIFKYITAENSIVNAVVWKCSDLAGSVGIGFTLNGENIVVKVPDLDIIIKTNSNKASTLDLVKKAICDAISGRLIPHILADVVNVTLRGKNI